MIINIFQGLSKLDQYLISVFRPFDSENTGFVKI